MASFNGTDLGAVVEVVTAAAPHELQITAYPGVNGLAVNALGSRGGTSEANGLCYGENPSDLLSIEGVFRGYVRDATLGTLVDTLDSSWDNVVMVDFTPIGQITFAPGFGWCREFKATFLHVSFPS